MTAVGFLLAVAPAVAAPSPGSLLKIAGNTAVYWYGTDGKRHAFPSAGVYGTWFADFKDVQTVSAADLAAISLGATVKYRPGTRLIKLATDPKVYAVEPDGLLRWVATEQAALRLYGTNWSKRIDDVPDTFFVDYRVGTELDGTRPPVGAVVRGTDGQLSLVGASDRQPLAGAAAAFLARFAVEDSGWLAGIPAVASLSTAAVPFGEAVINYPATPTFAFAASPSRFASPGRDVTLGAIQLTTDKSLQVRQLGLRFDALRDASDGNTPDADLGGLIYGNNIRANFSNLRLVDEAGRLVYDARDLSINSSNDQSQAVTWTGDWRVAARSRVTLKLVANVNVDIPDGEPYRFTFLPSYADVRDGAAVKTDFLPKDELKDDNKAVMGTALAVTIPSGSAKTIRGAVGVTAFTVSLASGALDTTLNALTFQSYLHTSNANGYLEGGNVDGGVEVRVRDFLPRLSLYEGSERLAGPSDVDFNGRVSFSGLGRVLKAGTVHELKLVGDIAKTVSLGDGSDIIAFDLNAVTNQVQISGPDGTRLDATLATPNFLNGQPRQYVQVKDHGTLHGSWQATGGDAMAGDSPLAGTLTLTATDDSYVVNALAFRQDGDQPRSFPSVRLDYPDRDGKTVSKRVSFDNTLELPFTNLGLFVPAGQTVTAKLYADVLPYAAGPVYGENLKLRLMLSGPLQFTSDATAEVHDESSLGTTTAADYYFEVGQANVLTVRFSNFTVLHDAASPSGTIARNSNTEVMRFIWKADGSGRVRVRKVVFRVTPGDAGREGQDSLEYWASRVGDLDANSVIDLVRVDADNNETIVGEDSTTALRYRVCGGSGGCSEPGSVFTSGSGQYAEFTYDFNVGSEFPISGGETGKFRLKLDTTGFWKADSAYKDGLIPLTVTLSGYSDLLWTDAPGQNYDVRAATKGDLPVVSSLQIEKP